MKTQIKKYEVKNCSSSDNRDMVLEYKKRLIKWPNPVEYVNNMYGCHPDDKRNTDYFEKVYSK